MKFAISRVTESCCVSPSLPAPRSADDPNARFDPDCMFHFSLQNVLEVRERFEKIKYNEYSAELLVQQGLEEQFQGHLGALGNASTAIDRTKQATRSALPMRP